MKALKEVYLIDSVNITNLPILSVGINISTLEHKVRFQYDMYETYKKIELNLKIQPSVDMRIFQCVACRYGLELIDLYQNMIQIREKKERLNGTKYHIC